MRRDELLNEPLFLGIDHARQAIGDWVRTYNTERPHSALGSLTPMAFAAQLTSMADRLRAAETLRRSPIAPSAHTRDGQPPAPVSAE
ncbi:integrase core domain-containing protein [Jannaschia formosa]|uniref:integrase core domain-containing protein n=1 Tax=Jannaschia formosa TaxID=2259592 RepID=UPI000E1B7CC9|nr:transposase [Jannaschia formosa]